MGAGASLGASPSHSKVPREVVASLVSAGTVLPCELKGPYDVSAYHLNASGLLQGFSSAARRADWHNGHQASLEGYATWADVDIGAVDADFAMTRSRVDDKMLDLRVLAPRIEAERAKMEREYFKAAESAALKEPAAHAALTTDDRYASR